jgi:hypothetical protein
VGKQAGKENRKTGEKNARCEQAQKGNTDKFERKLGNSGPLGMKARLKHTKRETKTNMEQIGKQLHLGINIV